MLGWLIDEIFYRSGHVGLPPGGCLVAIALVAIIGALVFGVPVATAVVIGFLSNFHSVPSF